jgi:hypothetical protein
MHVQVFSENFTSADRLQCLKDEILAGYSLALFLLILISLPTDGQYVQGGVYEEVDSCCLILTL